MEDIKKDIVESAHRYFNYRGIKFLNLDVVAKDCNISRRILSSYFDKEKLVEEIISKRLANCKEALKMIARQKHGAIKELSYIFGLIEQLAEDFSDVFLRELKKYYHPQWLLVNHFVEEALKKVFQKNLTKASSKGIFRESIQPALLTEIYFSTITMLMEKGFGFSSSSIKLRTIREMNKNFLLGLMNFDMESTEK